MSPENQWMRCARLASEVSGPPAPVRAAAVRALLWLCSEGAPAPHAVRPGGRGRSIVFGWAQGGASVQVEVAGTGRPAWRAALDGDGWKGGRLGPQAVQALRYLIPLACKAKPGPPGRPVKRGARSPRV